MAWREFLFGKPLRTEDEQAEQIGVSSGVAVLGLDALASASYGPEAALVVLLPLGSVASASMMPLITACIVGVLFTVFLSYRQTIAAYPQGGGSFTVAYENLGAVGGLLAASALAIDYVLNVAVAISAGVGALVSTLPVLLPETLPLCLGLLALLMIVNLRGIRTAGLVFMFPAYLFVAGLGGTIAYGLVQVLLTNGHPSAEISPPRLPATMTAASSWLYLRAFASGCAALTGIEAVSNAVPIFRPPAVRLARRTLTVLVATLGFLLLGIGVLAHGYNIGATRPADPGYESVISQLIATVAGRGLAYYVTMASVFAVLALSANTSFADFPRVCRVLAQHEFLPAEFAHRGSRLVYSAGILLLAILSAVLLIAFGGITDRLIPLFAVGAFLAFTLSQLGMVVHWWRRRATAPKRFLVLNAMGAAATAATLCIIAVAKFAEGAWLTLLILPLLVVLFRRIRRYHDQLNREIALTKPLDLTPQLPPVVVVPLKRLDRTASKALRQAMALSSEVRVIQVLAEEMKMDDLSGRWDHLVEEPARAAGRKPPYLKVVYSPYREFFGPLLVALNAVGEEYPDRTVAVLIPEIVDRHWYHLFFRHRTTLLKTLLLLRGGPRIMLITTPWYFQSPPKTGACDAGKSTSEEFKAVVASTIQ